MSTYKTARGKLVALGGIHLAVHEHDGSLTIRVGDKHLDLTEDEASRLHDLMADVVQWESNAGMTEGAMNRISEHDEADIESGKLEDDRAHQGR